MTDPDFAHQSAGPPPDGGRRAAAGPVAGAPASPFPPFSGVDPAGPNTTGPASAIPSRRALGPATQSALHDAGFDLEEAVAAGGFGVVYRARDRRLGRPVAIKVIDRVVPTRGDPGALPREIETLASFQHPHIVPLFEAGVLQGGQRYLVMPWIDGTSLRRRLRTNGPLPVAEVLRIGIDLADALAALHAQGLVHRDIKPENVMTDGAHATVIDFGLVGAMRAADGADASGERLMGTPPYMSPEQWRHDGLLDGRADVYSLGCLLFELLAGHPPGQAPRRSPLAMRARDWTRWSDTLRSTDTLDATQPTRWRATPRVRATRRDVPAALDRLLHRAMTRSARRRLPSAEAFRDGLQQVQARLLNDDDGRRTRRLVLTSAIATVLLVPWLLAVRLDDREAARYAALSDTRVLLTVVRDTTRDPLTTALSTTVQAALARRLTAASGPATEVVLAEAPPLPRAAAQLGTDASVAAAAAAEAAAAVAAIRPLALAEGTGTVIALSVDRVDDRLAVRGLVIDAKRGAQAAALSPAIVPASSEAIPRVADSLAVVIAAGLRPPSGGPSRSGAPRSGESRRAPNSSVRSVGGNGDSGAPY
jgi:serine/threonine-protein kinase